MFYGKGLREDFVLSVQKNKQIKKQQHMGVEQHESEKIMTDFSLFATYSYYFS